MGEDQLEAIPLLKVSFYATGNAGIRSGCGPGLVFRTARVRRCRHSFIAAGCLFRITSSRGYRRSLWTRSALGKKWKWLVSSLTVMKLG